jgi:hypothetical protein
MTRRTFHYDEALGKMVEGPGRRRSDGSGDGWRFSDRTYSGTPFVTPDGTVINSKKKHQAYMKRTGLTTADDYAGEWRRKAEKRAEFYRRAPDPTRKEDVERAFYKSRSG